MDLFDVNRTWLKNRLLALSLYIGRSWIEYAIDCFIDDDLVFSGGCVLDCDQIKTLTMQFFTAALYEIPRMPSVGGQP